MKEGGNKDAGGRCSNFDIIKTARYTNLLVSLILIIIVILNFVNIVKAAFDPFDWLIITFEGIFGMIMMSASFGLGCVKRNFLFMLTGKGKGLFNIFVGSILIACDAGKSVSWYNYAMGGACIGTGLLFIGLSTCKNMTDD